MNDTRNIESGIRDENSLTGSGCAHFNWWDGDSFEIDSGMRDLNSKWPFENLTRRDWDRDSESGGMKPNLVAGCGIYQFWTLVLGILDN